MTMLLDRVIVTRLSTVYRVLQLSKKCQSYFPMFVRWKSDDIIVSITDVSKTLKRPSNPEYVPRKYLSKLPNQNTLTNLRWMLQKDLLHQDIFLIGTPGSKRRHLAMGFLELTEKEVEYISLSRDTTEADLKQRKEIKNGTAYYHDQSAVRAAINGRVLIIEGVEKAERNVLPVLNNLLENREMHLEDGRFLIPASRYDILLKEHSLEELEKWRLVRVSDEFRVIALGLPSPRYPGYPLDPPLRSRFQGRHVSSSTFKDQYEELINLVENIDSGVLNQLLSCAHALSTREAKDLCLQDFPLDNLHLAALIMGKCPNLPVFDIFYRFYPYKLFLGKEGKQAVEDVLKTFDITNTHNSTGRKNIDQIKRGRNSFEIITKTDDNRQFAFHVPYGCKTISDRNIQENCDYVDTNYQNDLLVRLLESHSASADLCLIGPKGCGKSITVRKFAHLLNYEIEPILLYQDMTSRELIQQRTTLPNGDTVWRNSPLVTSALEGKLAVLDGIHRMHPSTLATLQRLVHDRELQLHDGKRLLKAESYDEIKSIYGKSDEDMLNSGILRIHPSFEIIALAEPGQWLNSELLNLFIFHEMRPLDKLEEIHIIQKKYGEINKSLSTIIELAHKLRSSNDQTLQSLAGSFSTRQLMRIAQRMSKYPTEDVYGIVQKACLTRFLPTVAKQALEDCLKRLNVVPLKQKSNPVKYEITDNYVKIGNTSVERYKTTNITKVPNIIFYDVPQHVELLEILLQDFSLGQHLLLVGNQGVGKNKIIDRLLQILNRPREYIQLHRDTTVQTLTVQTMVENGKVIYEDSPLVKAIKWGHVLVVDEADKAPTYVTCVLKTLIESGEMILSDGRRIIPTNSLEVSNDIDKIPIHPDFRMIVLANRPGFPFLGNDFFAALGDLFSTHSVDNPNIQSEIHLLKQYGPDVNDQVILKLVKAFDELRNMADKGLVSYPYSTREVVSIVKHLQRFPNEPLASVVQNVFDFDCYTEEVYSSLIKVLQKNGIPVGIPSTNIALAKKLSLPKPQPYSTWNISDKEHHLPVQKRTVKIKRSILSKAKIHIIDQNEGRSAWFTELSNYWDIPMPQSSMITALTVSNDRIIVLAKAPLNIFTMSLGSNQIQEISLQDLIQTKNNRTSYTLASDKDKNLWIHDENSNTILSVNLEEKLVQEIQFSSLLDIATDKISNAFGNNTQNKWKMVTDLLPINNHIIFYTPNDHKIHVFDKNNLLCYSMSLPFNIKSIALASSGQWLIYTMEGTKFLLEKILPTKSEYILKQMEEVYHNNNIKLDSPFDCGQNSLKNESLYEQLGKNLNTSNRLFSNDHVYAALADGFPLSNECIEFYVWLRERTTRSLFSLIMTEDNKIVRIVSRAYVPTEANLEDAKRSGIDHYLEIVDIADRHIRYIPLSVNSMDKRNTPIYASLMSNQDLVTVDGNGSVKIWQISLANIQNSFQSWQKELGKSNGELQVTKERYSGLDVSKPKHGKVDEKNEPHVGGNTWAGGTGGRDTAGLGGKGGPYRLDAGHTVHQLSDDEKNAVPEHVQKAAREMGLRAFKQRLKDIQMSEYDHSLYSQFSNAVEKQVKSLRVILGSLQAKTNERQWCRHQTFGELDDNKLIEGLTGERTIYRRRTDKEPEIGSPLVKPKRLKLVVDVSGSMYRFNGYDERLNREMEACVMVMEAFSGYEDKFKYDIMGHSGDDYNIIFVPSNQPPTDDKKRLEVIKTMHAHSQYCMSGDNTLQATQHAINVLSQEDNDESIVIVLSDANLERYGIPANRFGKVLTSNSDVNAFAIFIGSLGDQATRLMTQLPASRAFVCMDLKDIPRILQQIFAASLLSTTRSN